MGREGRIGKVGLAPLLPKQEGLVNNYLLTI